MNKTIKINLVGFVFQLDEDAYEVLKSYLVSLERVFEHVKDGKEVISDIESRIAELLQSLLNNGKEVINLADINEVISLMGSPESYIDDEPAYEAPRTSAIKEKLYKESQTGIIGGVAAGLGTHLNINPAWIRLAFVLSAFVYSIGFWLYLILWIILPKRNTPLSAKGLRDETPFVELWNKIFRLLGQVIKFLLRTVTVILGLMLLLTGFPVLVALFGMSVFPAFKWGRWGGFDLTEMYDFVQYALMPDGSVFFIVLLVIVVFVPLLLLTYWGVKLLFVLKVKDSWLHMTAGLSWLAASILLGVLIPLNANLFFENSRSFDKMELSVEPDTLRIMMNDEIDLELFSQEMSIVEEEITYYYNSEKRLSRGLVSFNAYPARDSLAYFTISKDVGGSTKSNARHHLRSVGYKYVFNGDHLALDESFVSSNRELSWIPSLVEVDLLVPRNTVLVVDKRIKRLYNAEHSLSRLSNRVIYVDMEL